MKKIIAVILAAFLLFPTAVPAGAKVPANLFTDVKISVRPYHGDLIDLICGTFMWIYTNLGAPLDKYF